MVKSLNDQTAAYEPVPRNTAWPKERYPVRPNRRLKPIANSPKMANFWSRSG